MQRIQLLSTLPTHHRRHFQQKNYIHCGILWSCTYRCVSLTWTLIARIQLSEAFVAEISVRSVTPKIIHLFSSNECIFRIRVPWSRDCCLHTPRNRPPVLLHAAVQSELTSESRTVRRCAYGSYGCNLYCHASTPPATFSSKSSNLLFGYFSPVKIFFDNKNT